jgi:hypothetical protein
MPDDAGRDAAFYDHENEPRRHVADWGGDELFTRTPRRRTIHSGPPPRFRRPAPIDPIHRPGSESTGRFRVDGDDRGHDGSPEGLGPVGDGRSDGTIERDPQQRTARFARTESGATANTPPGRRTVVIAGRPDGVPRPPRDRRRRPRTVAERVGPRPERIVAWAFALGLLLILIAIATADAATI